MHTFRAMWRADALLTLLATVNTLVAVVFIAHGAGGWTNAIVAASLWAIVYADLDRDTPAAG